MRKYRQIVGYFRYLASWSHLDLWLIASKLGADNHAPTARHWKDIKAAVRYFTNTINTGITYRCSKHSEPHLQLLTEYKDFSFGGNNEGRKSTSGLYVSYYNGPVAWATRKQILVTLYRAGAEYIYREYGMNYACAIQRMLIHSGITPPGKVVIRIDNRPTLEMVRKPFGTNGAKLIDLRHHLIWDTMQKMP